jgi:hypothetical protein
VVVGVFAIQHSFVTVEGFTLDGGDGITSTGDFCEILGNHLRDTGIRIPYRSSTTGCLVARNHIEGTRAWGSDWTAIYTGGSNHRIEANEIGPSVDTDALRPFGQHIIIRGNYIHDLTLSSGSRAHSDVFQVFGDNGYEVASDVVFEGNRIVRSSGQMFMTSVGLDGTGGDRVHDFDVRNNVWVDIALQGNIGIPNLRFSNNTLINVGRANGFALYFGPAVYSVATGAEITNNLFVDPGGQSGTSAAAAYTIRQGSGYRIDHNYVTRGPAHGWAALSGFA